MSADRQGRGRSACLLLLTAAIMLFPAWTTASRASGLGPRQELSRPLTDQRTDVERVLALVEQRSRDPKVLERMRGKLAHLKGSDLRLASRLCERISRDADAPGAEFAFSVVLAMVMFS